MQIVIAFALFGVLQGIKTGVDLAIAAARADLLDVRPKVRGGSPLPLAYFNRIKALPGVKLVSLLNGFSATYQNPTQELYVLAIDPDKAWLTESPEIFKISPGSLDALEKTRNGRARQRGPRKEIRLEDGRSASPSITDDAAN
ncbi:MAG TPA: hypothetical protein VGG63_15215 [Steroidobacteraceae bacterium]